MWGHEALGRVAAVFFGFLKTHIWILLALGQGWELSEGLASQGGQNLTHQNLTYHKEP